MKDVQQAVDNAVGAIRDFARENLNRLTLSYLSDVVNQTYLTVDMGALALVPEDTVRSVINRIDDTILSRESKAHLSKVIGSLGSKKDATEHDRLIYHYFSTILRFQNHCKQEKNPFQIFVTCAVNIYLTSNSYIIAQLLVSR